MLYQDRGYAIPSTDRQGRELCREYYAGTHRDAPELAVGTFDLWREGQLVATCPLCEWCRDAAEADGLEVCNTPKAYDV